MSSNKISQKEFGKTGEQIGSIGYGSMGLSAFYGTPVNQSTADELLKECLSRGVNMIDSADVYAPMKSGKPGYGEILIGKFLSKNPDQRKNIFLSTKFGQLLTEKGITLHADHDYCLRSCDESLKRLGVDQIDLYYNHRPDPNPEVDVTETVGAMKKLKEQGKIRYIGVSEYTLDQLERANKVVHIDAVQIELSPWTPEVLTNGILEWCEKNGTALIAYAPLGRGFLTGQYKSPDDFEEGDFRKNSPRFQGENFKKNLKLVDDIKKIAEKKNATSGQIALAWVMSKSPMIIPIPGTKQIKYLNENINTDFIKLSKEDIEEIDDIVNSFNVSGGRYPEAQAKVVAF